MTHLAPRFLNNALKKTTESISFHKDRKDKLEKLDLQFYSEYLSLPILVPIGTKVLLRGNLMHNTEFFVALSNQYFTKCSLKQAEELRQHRICSAKNYLKELEKEKDFLSNHTKLINDSIFDTNSREIIEPYDEDEELKWREAHKYNLRKEKTSNIEENVESYSDVMTRLDELELQEEIENMKEYDIPNGIDEDTNDLIINNAIEIIANIECKYGKSQETKANINSGREIGKARRKDIHEKLKNIHLKLDKECNSEEVMLKRLDALEEEEMLLDELDRLSKNSSETNSEEATEDEEYRNQEANSKIPQRISFNCQIEEANTLTINFSHFGSFEDKSDSKSTGDHNTQLLLESPKDIYFRFPECFSDDSKPLKSILKHELDEVISVKPNTIKMENGIVQQLKDNSKIKSTESSKNVPIKKEIVVGDIIENNKTQLEKPTNRPISKFRAARLKSRNT